jgi:hypothetical protein
MEAVVVEAVAGAVARVAVAVRVVGVAWAVAAAEVGVEHLVPAGNAFARHAAKPFLTSAASRAMTSDAPSAAR